MMEAATDVLIARSRVQETWMPVVSLSVLAHALGVAAMLFMPAADFSDDAPKTVMTISLGGAPGPRAGGMSAIGGRTVQEVAPDAAAPRAEAPPATKAPEMTLPSKNVRPRQEAKTQTAAKEAAGRTPTRGAEIQEGSARADTGARGRGFGLSGGGGGGASASVDTNLGDFCCPEYLETIIQMINRNWNSKQGLYGQTAVKATIERNGTLTNIQVERPSGFPTLDTASQRALLLTARVPPLPAQFPNPSLTIHFVFKAER
jgi:TonB family protein